MSTFHLYVDQGDTFRVQRVDPVGRPDPAAPMVELRLGEDVWMNVPVAEARQLRDLLDTVLVEDEGAQR